MGAGRRTDGRAQTAAQISICAVNMAKKIGKIIPFSHAEWWYDWKWNPIQCSPVFNFPVASNVTIAREHNKANRQVLRRWNGHNTPKLCVKAQRCS